MAVRRSDVGSIGLVAARRRFTMWKPREIHGQEPIMATGTIKWFNADRGYGFVQPDDGSGDVFVHISSVETAGLGDLREGQRVSYNLPADASRRERNVASALKQANAEVGAFQSRDAEDR